MHFALGNTYRGLIAGAITGAGAAFLSAWNGATTWHEAIGVVFGIVIVLVSAVLDQGSKPAKADMPA